MNFINKTAIVLKKNPKKYLGWNKTVHYTNDNLPFYHDVFFNNLLIEFTPRQIGNPSVFGMVYMLENSNRYIAKVQIYESERQLQTIVDELNTLCLPDIGKVGVRCIGFNLFDFDLSMCKLFSNKLKTDQDLKKYKTFPKISIAILDNFEKGNKREMSMTVGNYLDYFKKHDNKGVFKMDACPVPYHPLYKMMYKTLRDFYKITKRVHGDLHNDNIAVVLKKTKKIEDIKSGKAIKRIMIFDYGATVKIIPNKNIKDITCLKEILESFETNYMAKTRVLHFPKRPLVRVVTTKNAIKNQPVRFNLGMLNLPKNQGGVWEGFNMNKTKKYVNVPDKKTFKKTTKKSKKQIAKKSKSLNKSKSKRVKDSVSVRRLRFS